MKREYPYITQFTITGYKSIKDVSGEFMPGLNIVIGNNGSGKTNLLHLLEKVLTSNYTGLNDFDFSASIKIKEDVTREQIKKVKAVQKDTIERFNLGPVVIEEEVFQKPYYVKLVAFEIPKKLVLLDEEFNPKYNFKEKRIFSEATSGEFLFALDVWLFDVFNEILDEKNPDEITDDFLYQNLQSGFEQSFSDVKKNLNQYTPIENIRLSDSIRVAKTDASTFELRNLVFEYQINGEWLSWNALSDGTKRLIYMVFALEPVEISINNSRLRKIVSPIALIEEPELGIHPHQLHLLLGFLKEKAESQQIIITTHSPQVLDVLGENELDRIFITEIEPEKGTAIRKLNKNEIAKAKKYLEQEGMLSDYWRFSDFQRSKVSL